MHYIPIFVLRKDKIFDVRINIKYDVYIVIETKEKEKRKMAFCKYCGKEIEENVAFCAHCGAAQKEQTAEADPTPVQTATQYQTSAPQMQEPDNGGFGWGLLGCCVPVVGLILFLVWKDTKPKTAKAAGIGALVSVIATVLIYVVYFVLILSFGIGAGLLA